MWNSLLNYLDPRNRLTQMYPTTRVGSWGTPEFGITEARSDLAGIPRNAQGGSENIGNFYQDPNQTQTLDRNYQNAINAGYGGSPTSTPSPQVQRPQGQVLGASANGGDVQTGFAKFLADLENAKRSSQGIINSGQRWFDTFNQGIGDFENRTNQLYSDADQQITNTFGQLAGSNARLGQDARTQAILNSRVGNYGDSSRQGALNKVTGSLAGMQGAALAKRGENQNQNTAIQSERLGQANQSRLQASNKLADTKEYAGNLEREAGTNANFDFGQFLSNLQAKNNALQSLQAPNANGLTQMNPDFSGLTNMLNSNMVSSLSPNGQGQLANMNANLAQDPYTKLRQLLGQG